MQTIMPVRAAATLWLAAVVAGGCGSRAEAVTQAAAPPAPKVTVAHPVVASVAEFSEHTGRAESPETVDIRARASGHLVRVAFHEGELVKKGDLLFVVDPRPYQASLARARADLESIQADHELAKKNTARDEQLYKEKVINEREWDIQRASLAQTSARRSAAAAAVQSAALDLDYTQIRSPIDGRIGRIQVTVGNLVGPSTPTPLATVVSVDPLYVYVDVDEVQGLRLRRDGKGAARIGLPGEEGYPHEAPITFLDNRVDPATGTLRVRAVLKNPDGALSAGLFARVQITYGTVQQVVLVSDRAIGTDQDRRFVWVIGQDGKAAYRKVKLGALEGGLRVVRDGLAANDRVVVRGLQRIRPGVEVTPELIQMNAVDKDNVTEAATR